MRVAESVQSELARQVLHEFIPRFAPSGRLLWLFDGGLEPAFFAAQWIRRSRLSPAAVELLPNIVVRDSRLHRLWLIGLPELGRQITSEMRIALKDALKNTSERLLFTNVLNNRHQLSLFAGAPLWGTIAWFADEPDHMVVFDDAVNPWMLRPAGDGRWT